MMMMTRERERENVRIPAIAYVQTFELAIFEDVVVVMQKFLRRSSLLRFFSVKLG